MGVGQVQGSERVGAVGAHAKMPGGFQALHPRELKQEPERKRDYSHLCHFYFAFCVLLNSYLCSASCTIVFSEVPNH